MSDSEALVAVKRSSKNIVEFAAHDEKSMKVGRSPVQLIPNTNSALHYFRSIIPIGMSQKRREKLNGFPVFHSTFAIPEINKQLDRNIYRMW